MKKRLLCFGDSNTYGYDPRSYFGDRYPRTVRWTGLLNAMSEWEIVNYGQNGQEIPRHPYELDRAEALIAGAGKLDGLLVMLGGNDLLQDSGLAAEAVTARMEGFLRRLTACPALSGVRLMLIAPPPMVPGAWVGEERLVWESLRLSQCYAELARKLGIGFADAGTWKVELTFDGVHISESGHRAFAASLAETLKRMFAI